MTNEDWKEVEQKATSLFSVATLMCDGYKVELQMQRQTRLKNVIAVYVDGKIRGADYAEETEISRKFGNLHTRSVYTKKFLKTFPTKYAKELAKKKISFYSPYWGSFSRLKAHLIKNCTDIQIVEDKDNE